MKMMTSVKFKLNKNRLLKNGTYPLVVQVIHLRSKSWIYTPYRLVEDVFNELTQTAKYVKGVNTKHLVGTINAELRKMKGCLDDIMSDLSESGDFTVRQIVDRYRLQQEGEKPSRSNELLGYMHQRIEEKTRMKKDGIAAAYKSTMRSLAKFINHSRVYLKDVNCRFVDKYIIYLASDGVKQNTINFYLRNFSAMYNHAVEQGYLAKGDDPFANVTIRVEETDKRALSKEELIKIADADLSACSEEICRARDIFMFSYYTFGMSFIDIMSLKKENVAYGDMNYLCYSRTKTHQLLRVPILEHIQSYLDKYSSNSDYLFAFAEPKTPDAFYKHYQHELGVTIRALKKLGILLGMKSSLTTYVARHTFATLARDAGNAYSLIGCGLGHTTEETTRIYLKNFELRSLTDLGYSVVNL